MFRNLYFYFSFILFLTAMSVKGQTSILAVNSSSKTISQLSAADGSVINASFINLSSLNTGTIKAIIQVQNKIWISDQTSNVIYVFNLDGSYSSTIPSSTGLSNIRGLNIVNNEVWVTNAGTANGATANSIRRLDFNGNSLGVYATISSPFDVIDNGNGSAYVGSFNNDGIQTISYNGTVTGNLVQSGVLSGIQQINKTQDGNFVLAVFSSNTSAGNNAGVYLVSSANGSIINKWTVGGARGAIQAGNGNYLYTTGNGIYSLNPATGISTQIIAGSYQYMGKVNTSLLNIDETQTFAAAVYPNPASGTVFLQSKEEISSATLYSLTGQVVKRFQHLSGNKEKIDITDLPSNTYILKLQTLKGETKSFKIIKK